MRLIANKPCQFGIRKFFIGDEIPAELVTDIKAQERLGVISVANDESAVAPGERSGTLYTQEQLDEKIAEVIAELETNEGTVQIVIKAGNDSASDQIMEIPATPEQIQQTFEIMQLNADKASGAIADVADENVLTMIAFVDGRNTVKKAAKSRLDNLSSAEGENNDASNGNGTEYNDKEGET